MNQITIYDLLPLLRKGYVVMSQLGDWYWFCERPRIVNGEWACRIPGKRLGMFKIAPFDGDWKDSLMKCGNVREQAEHKDNK